MHVLRSYIHYVLSVTIVAALIFFFTMHAQQSKTPPHNNFCLLIIRNGTFYGTDLEKYLKNRKISYFVANKDADFRKVMKHTFNGVILSGGPLLYSEKNLDIENININFAAILNLDCPILGICFGHQTITELFGGKMRKMKALSKGMQQIKIVKKIDLFDGLPQELEVGQNHYDCSTEIPYNFELIATSDICPIEGIQHQKKPIFGVQFHPESSGSYGYRILDNFLKLCKCSLLK